MATNNPADALRGVTDVVTAGAVAGGAALKAIQELSRTPSGALPAIPPVGDLLFDLADLQMQHMKALADLGQKQSGALLEHIKKQRGLLSGRSTLPRALVSVTLPTADGKPGKWPVAIKNKSGKERTFTLPDLAEFVLVGTRNCEDSVFVKVEFFDGPAATTSKDEIKVPTTGATVYLSFAHDPRFEAKNTRYRASLILEPAEGLPLELLVELLVTAPAPSAAPPPTQTGAV